MKKVVRFRKGRNELKSVILTFASLLIFPTFSGNKEVTQEETEPRKLLMYITIPIMCIVLAELLIFSDRIATAICVHIGILIALSFSTIFIKDLRISKTYKSLMILPVLRLISLSTPIFFKTTLYALISLYIPLIIPVAAIIIYHSSSFKDIGITSKNFFVYLILSIPLGFLLGLGEYLIVRPEYMISDLTLGSLFKLTFVMVFFIGLVEELIFRSIIQTRLEQTLNIQGALIATSFLFGFMHSGYGNFCEILYASFAGFIIGFVFYKTRSLPFVAVLHGFSNVFLFGILPHYMLG